jgi:predicted metal-dependent hydrolase
MIENKTPSKSILLGTNYVPYQVRFSNRVQRWRLSVTAEKVEIVLPEGSHFHPEKLLREYAAWILEKQEKLRKRKAKIERKALPDGQIFLGGKLVHLEIRPAAILERQRVTYYTDRISVVSGKLSPAVLLKKWMTGKAEEAISRQVQIRATQMGVRPVSISIRSQRTRWGSCSSSGTLSFNWRLIMAPPEVLDYVVVHELAHMRQKNHSKAFWALVGQYCPHYSKFRLWLKQNQAAMWPGLFE